jgi:hypothetical protein
MSKCTNTLCDTRNRDSGICGGEDAYDTTDCPLKKAFEALDEVVNACFDPNNIAGKWNNIKSGELERK